MAASGSDLADFLIGTPDASAISFGNADKYLRQSVYDAFTTDDWRVNPQLTINAGVRWEYGAPITETQARLVNLDVAPGFATVAAVLSNQSAADSLPPSLMFPDRSGVEPRIGVSMRPIPGSSMLVSAGYGITYDTSVYQGIAIQMAQQAPLATGLYRAEQPGMPIDAREWVQSLSRSNAAGLRRGSRLSRRLCADLESKVQRDLPGSLQLLAAYVGIKGTHGAQVFLPNTNPVGAANPCTSCPWDLSI